VREYIYEIDLPTAKITRTWSSAAEFPGHLNSDVEISDDNIMYVASGGSHGVLEIPLDRFAEFRFLECIPRWTTRLFSLNDQMHTLLGAMSRKASVTSTHYMLQTLQITGWRILDGIYATRVSPDGKYIITGNRGYNTIAVYDRKTFRKVYEKLLPFRKKVTGRGGYNHYHLTSSFFGYHLGVHHSELIAR
jgi:DNA-binding beta-propeller fold protein YncE